jgi:hypothetical protein
MMLCDRLYLQEARVVASSVMMRMSFVLKKRKLMLWLLELQVILKLLSLTLPSLTLRPHPLSLLQFQ